MSDIIKKRNLIQEIDDFLIDISPNCEAAVGVMKIERSILITEIERLKKENEELKSRLKR